VHKADRNTNSRSFWLWLGLFGAPILWLIHLEANYAMVPFACVRQSSMLLLFSTALILILAAATAMVNWRSLRHAKTLEGHHSASGRVRFMATLGLLNTILFSLIILAQGIAAIMLSPCPG
jgi:hypothetical protein